MRVRVCVVWQGEGERVEGEREKESGVRERERGRERVEGGGNEMFSAVMTRNNPSSL